MKKLSLLTGLLLTACVTINIYFPAAAAEKAADEIIRDIQSITPGQPPAQQKAPEPKAALDWRLAALHGLDTAIAWLIPSAQADAAANLSIDSADIRQLRTSMENRYAALKVYYDNGIIGLQSDGLITLRNPTEIPLKDRNPANKLVSAENADRQRLYQAIADANGHPEWAGQIQSTFAARWISNAQPGWWYQNNDGWKQR